MSRFLSESRFQDPTNPRRRSLPAGLPFYAVSSVESMKTETDADGFGFELDDHELLTGKPMVSRHGIYRRGFRSSGPEIGEDYHNNG